MNAAGDTQRFVFDRVEGIKRVGARFFAVHGELLLDRRSGVGSLRIADRVAEVRFDVLPAPAGQPELLDFGFESDGFRGRGSASIDGGRIEGRLFPHGQPHASFGGTLVSGQS